MYTKLILNFNFWLSGFYKIFLRYISLSYLLQMAVVKKEVQKSSLPEVGEFVLAEENIVYIYCSLFC